MLGQERIQRLLEEVLRASRADETEAVLFATDSALTRFANSEVHQNVAESNVELRVRAVRGRRVGVAVINSVEREAVERVVERARQIAERSPERPHFPGLPDPEPLPSAETFSPATAELTPERRARSVKTICDLAVERGLAASGAFSSGTTEIAVANSRGVFAYAPVTQANLRTVIMGADGSGYAARVGKDASQFDAEEVAREAVERALRSQGPTVLEPGEYPVLLEHYAVGELLDYLSYMGFSALALQEGRSFLCDRLGQQIVSEQISIWDDGLDPRGTPLPFDFEGVPKRRVDLIERGVARGVVYDSETAAREGKRSTGHALPAPNVWGPFPINLFLGTGDRSRSELLGALDRGVLVTRFWYVNPVHPRQAVLTGMTRDGTFLVERGEIVRPVRNLRFTQSMLDALGATLGVGSVATPTEAFFGATVVPPLLLGRFTFTGVSEL